jgi:predicted Rossmann fold nucleotide-binding protein DprA/Smf involved in DNA uptake
MTDTSKEEAKRRTEMLANLRKQRHDKVKQAQALLKEQQTARKAIIRAMQGEPKTIPQIAEATGLPAHKVLWYVAAMKKYGLVAEAGMDEDYTYYLYKLTQEAAL